MPGLRKLVKAMQPKYRTFGVFVAVMGDGTHVAVPVQLHDISTEAREIDVTSFGDVSRQFQIGVGPPKTTVSFYGTGEARFADIVDKATVHKLAELANAIIPPPPKPKSKKPLTPAERQKIRELLERDRLDLDEEERELMRHAEY